MCRGDMGRSSFCFGGGSVNWEVLGNGADFSPNVTGLQHQLDEHGYQVEETEITFWNPYYG